MATLVADTMWPKLEPDGVYQCGSAWANHWAPKSHTATVWAYLHYPFLAHGAAWDNYVFRIDYNYPLYFHIIIHRIFQVVLTNQLKVQS